MKQNHILLFLTALVYASAAHAAGQSSPPAKANRQQSTKGKSAKAAVQENQAAVAQAALSDQEKSKGFFSGQHLDVLLRSFTNYQQIHGSPSADASVLGAQLNYQSGFTPGLIGFGADASVFGAFKLDGGKGAGDLVHVARDGGGQNQLAWAYMGVWDVKARVANTTVKYGLQKTDNLVFLMPHDNRALPPTFKGVSLFSHDIRHLDISAGRFDKVDRRGTTFLSNLSTEYGGVPVDSFTYLGATYHFDPATSVTVNGGRAQNVWDQYYVSAARSQGDPSFIKWSYEGDYYYTHNQGAAREGKIDTSAYSLSLKGQHNAHSILLGYQQVVGNQFFDYIHETAADLLTNSMDVDYNAPHEKSLQLRYNIDLGYYGLPGLSVMTWGVTGWGADATNGANANADPNSVLHNLYWKDGEPVHGRHYELGLIGTYVVPSGKLKGTQIQATFEHHHAGDHYSDSTSNVYRLMADFPISIL
jgi:hypothetical protein